jgi:hypothetical protein
MAKYYVEMFYPDGTSEEDDNLFDTEAEAREHGEYLCSCYRTGGEILHMSNPGDYPYNEDDSADFEVYEVDD